MLCLMKSLMNLDRSIYKLDEYVGAQTCAECHQSRMKNGWSLITITPWNYPMNKLYGQILTIPLLKTMA